MRTRDRSLGCLAVSLFLLLNFFNSAGSSRAQEVPPPGSGPKAHDSSAVQVPQEIGTNPQRPVVSGGSNAATLLIAPGDELEVTVYGAPDLSTHARVENDGNILLPLVGLVSVAGETSGHAGKKIEDSLQQAHLVKNPRVSVYVKDYTNAGISVAGQVTRPGVYPALGPHRLFDVLQAAGGPTEKAASSVIISHRDDPEHPITVTFSKDPREMARNNIDLQAGDTLVVPEAGVVYVLGEINRPGGYVMNSSGGVTVLQVVAAAGGPTRLASYGGVKIIRRTSEGLKELPVPLKPLLRAKVADLPLLAGDILYVPNSRTKSALASSSSLITALGTSAIYRVP
jgi:polysaccharide export outer membrane protein